MLNTFKSKIFIFLFTNLPLPSSPSIYPQPPVRPSVPSGLRRRVLEPVPAMMTTPPCSKAEATAPTVSLHTWYALLRVG